METKLKKGVNPTMKRMDIIEAAKFDIPRNYDKEETGTRAKIKNTAQF